MPGTLGRDRGLVHTGDGAFVSDEHGRIVDWNRAAERILGYSAGEVLGRACCDVLVARDERGNPVCDRDCEAVRLSRRGEPVESFDMETRTKGGRPIWLNVSIVESPTLWAGVPSLHLFRDVTATRAQIRPLRPAAGPGTANPGGGGTGLTPRELEILRLMGTGANTRAVSEQLHVSPATVRNHVQSILTKLEVHSRLAAVAYAMNHGLL